MNIAIHSVILCSRLQPKGRDVQLLCLLEQTERHLSSRSQQNELKGETKLTLALVTMLTEVSAGAGRSVRLGTVSTPSSSLSFYTGDIDPRVSIGLGSDGDREKRTGCTGVTGRRRAKYHCKTCNVRLNEQNCFHDDGLYMMVRTLVPNFDWSFDAPTTAYLCDERKSFCISATVRVMVKG